MAEIVSIGELLSEDMTWEEFHRANLEAIRVDTEIARVMTEIVHKGMELERLREKRDGLLIPLQMRLAQLANAERKKHH